MQAVGYYAQSYFYAALTQGWNEPPIGAEYANGCTPNYMHFRKVSIYSGSNEIQHNIIAKAGLGLLQLFTLGLTYVTRGLFHQ